MNNSNYPISLIVLVVITEVFGFITLVLVATWMDFSVNNPDNSPTFDYSTQAGKFAFHPFFLVFGYLFLMINAALMFRVLRPIRRIIPKILHAVLHAIVLIFAIVGIEGMFAFYRNLQNPHAFSIHSWIGITMTVIFAAQWVASLIIFFVPAIPSSVRASFIDVHKFVGNFMVLLAAGMVVTGIYTFLSFNVTYSSLEQGSVMGNVTGLFAIMFSALAFFILQYPGYRRTDDSEFIEVDTRASVTAYGR